MRAFIYFVFLILAACTADVLSPEVLSSKVARASSAELCSAYRLPSTTLRGKLMIEAELAARKVNQCGYSNYGQYSLSTAGTKSYERPFSSEAAGGDYDCDDFPNGAAAQRFFLASGGPVSDPHNMDLDGDGLACEWGAQIRKVSSYRRPVASVRRVTSRCYTGPRGGTYTITASGNKNYGGC